MVRVKPFKAIRPKEEYVKELAALPYDTMNVEEAREMAKNNENSYLRIDRAEIDFKEDIDLESKEVYKKAAANLEDFLERGVFIKEEEEHFYLYREVMGDRAQIGIVACVSVEDTILGKIKKHENTKPDKVRDRLKHIEYCKANTGTILLAYDRSEEIEKLILNKLEEKALYDFQSEDGIRHTVWLFNKDEELDIKNAFDRLDRLYIADGHHRSKAAVEYALKERARNPQYTGKEEFNYYLAMIAAKESMYVMDYNRVVKDLAGLEKSEFLKALEKDFTLEKSDKKIKPCKKYQYGMYMDGQWYKLEYKYPDKLKGEVEKLDVSVLHNYIIGGILGIFLEKDPSRIDFIGGIRGIEEIEKRVDKDMKLGFSLYPTSIDELIKIADMDKIMPAKSTWFEPKVRCGLFLHSL